MFTIKRYPQQTIVADILPTNSVIWRAVQKDQLSNPPTYTNDNPGKLGFVRVLLSGKFYGVCEPIVNPYKGPQKPHGIICFLESVLPDNWTHLVVTGHSKAGSSCFARPEAGDTNTLVEFSKLQQYYNRVASCNEEFMELVAGSDDGIVRSYAKRVQCVFDDGEYLVLNREDSTDGNG